MQRTRFQQGSITLQRRANGEHVWLYRWRDMSGTRRGLIFGTITQLRTLSLARAEASRLNLREKYVVGSRAHDTDKPTLGQLIERYKREAMPERYSTKRSYTCWLDRHILPAWGNHAIEMVDAEFVEQWLNEKPLSPKSKGHIKGLMTVLLNAAMKWKLIPFGRNPMQLVHLKGGVKRRSRPAILSQQQFRLLLENIQEDYVRLLVTVGMCLGLRFSEALGLQWRDFSWENLEVYVRRAIVQGRPGDVKTEYSEAPAPLDPALADKLQEWKAKSEFVKSSDWVFASPFMAGSQPYFPTVIRRKIHAAAERAGLANLLKHGPTKILRHSYRSWLGATDASVSVIKDLMRHADIRTTFNHYGNTMPTPMREANGKVVQMALRQRAG